MKAEIVIVLAILFALFVACSMKQVCYYLDPRELADGGITSPLQPGDPPP